MIRFIMVTDAKGKEHRLNVGWIAYFTEEGPSLTTIAFAAGPMNFLTVAMTAAELMNAIRRDSWGP
jgi:hypothetical protein